MNRTIARCLYGVLFAGGLTLFGATAAHAADTSGDNGVLSGTAVDAVVSVPVTIGGNAVSVVGDSTSDGAVSTAAPAVAPVGSSTSGNDAIASGSQVAGVVSVPVTVGGNAVSVIGDSSSTDAATPAPGSAPSEPGPVTSGNDSVVGGSQVAPVVTVPVTIGGNAVSVLGDSSSSGSTTGPASDAPPPDASSSTTSGNDSVLGGTQVAPAVSAPVNVGGNAVSVLGDSASTGPSTGASVPAGSSAPTTSGDDNGLGGTAIGFAGTAPIRTGLNSMGSIGTGVSHTTEDATIGRPSAAAVTLVAASAGPNLADTGLKEASILLWFSALMLLAGAAVTLRGRQRAVQRS
ncbi:chaplin family protein [Mycetocola sp.]|uniref:chaplin family protein n=1 Tax=Mycetocola sp. TaxID=1871042 RepID=UPI003988B3DE